MLHLTLNLLNNTMPGCLLAEGLTTNDPDGLNMTNNKKELRWVLKIGAIGDWCIYTYYSYKNAEWVADYGDKVTIKEYISNVIKIDDPEVWKRMRY